MKAQNRKEIFLKALANGEEPNIKPLTREEKLLAKQAKRESESIGGGTPHWDDIEGKPFEMVGSDTLTWDGNTEGRYRVTINNTPYYLVSEATPTATDMANGLKFTDSQGSVMELLFEDVAQVLDNGIIASELFFVIPQDNCDFNGITFGEQGLYMMWAEGINNVTAITINGYTGFNPQEKIKEEYLPSGGGAFVVNFTSTEEGMGVFDKTHDEIKQAIADGKIVMAKYEHGTKCYFYQLTNCNEGYELLIFSMIEYASNKFHISTLTYMSDMDAVMFMEETKTLS